MFFTRLVPALIAVSHLASFHLNQRHVEHNPSPVISVGSFQDHGCRLAYISSIPDVCHELDHCHQRHSQDLHLVELAHLNFQSLLLPRLSSSEPALLQSFNLILRASSTYVIICLTEVKDRLLQSIHRLFHWPVSHGYSWQVVLQEHFLSTSYLLRVISSMKIVHHEIVIYHGSWHFHQHLHSIACISSWVDTYPVSPVSACHEEGCLLGFLKDRPSIWQFMHFKFALWLRRPDWNSPLPTTRYQVLMEACFVFKIFGDLTCLKRKFYWVVW